VLAFLRWAENPRDRVAGFRVIQLLPGAGPATAARVLDRVARPNPRIERWQPGGNWVVSAANFGSERDRATPKPEFFLDAGATNLD
jgi:hypothetical protein